MKKITETMVEFWDNNEHQRDHEAFKKWQRVNNRGFVINFPVNQPNKLHKSGCPHIRDFSSNPNVSLTMHRKLCSSNGGELMTFARDQSIDFEHCDTCRYKSHDKL